MTKNTSITLGRHFATFVEGQVAHGRYNSTSEVVRAGLRLLEEHEAKMAALRGALEAGENSGPSQSFDFAEFVAGKREQQEG